MFEINPVGLNSFSAVPVPFGGRSNSLYKKKGTKKATSGRVVCRDLGGINSPQQYVRDNLSPPPFFIHIFYYVYIYI